MRDLGLDFLTATEFSPPELIEHAARNGCGNVCLLVQRMNPFPEYNLIGNTTQRYETREKSRDLGVRIDAIEVFRIKANTDPELFRPAFETAVYLGASGVNTLSFDSDEGRLGDTYAKLCEIAKEYGLSVLTEVHRSLAHDSITTAVRFFDKLGLDVKIELDSLHFYRYGGQIEEILRHRARIGRAQLCDGPAEATDEDYFAEAMTRRQIPGEGVLPLVAFIQALPTDIVIGVEVPSPDFEPAERITRALEASRGLVARARST